MHLHWVHVLKGKAFKREHMGQFNCILVSQGLFGLKSWAWGTKHIFSACFTLLSLINVCVCVVYMCLYVCFLLCISHGTCVKVRDQVVELCSLSKCRSPGLELGACLPSEQLCPSFQLSACVTLYRSSLKGCLLACCLLACSHPHGPAPVQLEPFLRPSPLSRWNSGALLALAVFECQAWLWTELFALTFNQSFSLRN